MSESENFLSRWSRRKQEAEHAADDPNDAQSVVRAPESTAAAPSEASAEAATEEKEPAFDVSTLPPIDSIDVGTDIRSFLQKGVPLDLTRAALRRAWSTDPAIRDFIGIAENQWDFATGSDIPGFGPLEASDDVRRLVAEVFQGRRELPIEKPAIANSDSPQLSSVQDTSAPENSEHAPQETTPWDSGERKLLPQVSSSEHENLPHCEEGNIATQQVSEDSHEALPIKPTHGRALPR